MTGEESQRDHAYRQIWKRIVYLDYPPLTLLNEKQLSAELGLGLSPIREALRYLEYDGLVMILPRRGTLTTEIGLTDVRSELEVRVELEGLAGRLAAQRGSMEEHEQLSAHVRMMGDVKALTDSGQRNTQFTDMDAQFHRMIYAQTRNKSLVRDLERHFSHALRIWFYCHRVRGSAFNVNDPSILQLENYQEAATALCERDPSRAEAAMRAHVTQDTERVLTLLENF